MLSTLYHLLPNAEDAGENTAEKDSHDSRCCPRVETACQPLLTSPAWFLTQENGKVVSSERQVP